MCRTPSYFNTRTFPCPTPAWRCTIYKETQRLSSSHEPRQIEKGKNYSMNISSSRLVEVKIIKTEDKIIKMFDPDPLYPEVTKSGHNCLLPPRGERLSHQMSSYPIPPNKHSSQRLYDYRYKEPPCHLFLVTIETFLFNFVTSSLSTSI